MSYDSSFTLCPSSNGGASAAYNTAPDQVKNTPAQEKLTLKMKDSSSPAPNHQAFEAKPQYIPNMRGGPEELQQRIIPGTLLQDWMLPSHNLRRFGPSSARSIRASPFEPLVHHRNLPKSGTISPLLVQEHGSTNISGVHGQPHRIPPASSTEPSFEHCLPAPPVAEIRIPTNHTLQEASNDEDNDDANTISSEKDEDFKTLYHYCQRDLQEAQEQVAETAEENRMLKRHLIQLQKQLYTCSRNKRPRATVSWSIPGSDKRQRRDGP
jgi:arsenate reductase-like glutaredoxin family protein